MEEQKPEPVPPVTRDSVARAWFAMKAERQVIFEETGMRIDDDGHVVWGTV